MGSSGWSTTSGRASGTPAAAREVRLAEQVRQELVPQVEQVAGPLGGGAAVVELAVAERRGCGCGRGTGRPGASGRAGRRRVRRGSRRCPCSRTGTRTAQATGRPATLANEVVPAGGGVAAPVEGVPLGAGEGRAGPDDPLTGVRRAWLRRPPGCRAAGTGCASGDRVCRRGRRRRRVPAHRSRP